MATAITTQLDYAHEPAMRRQRLRRRAFVVAILLALGVVSWKWCGAAWAHGQLLYWQGKCLAYVPAERPAVEGGVGGRSAACWDRFYELFSPPGRNAFSTVFLHELRKRDGTRRLVAVEASAFTGLGNAPDSEVSLEYHVIAPGSAWRRPVLVKNAEVRPYFYYEGGEGQHFDVLPGRGDPADGSHFTFDVRWRERTVTLDGWLRDDDTVLIEPRERLELLRASKY